MLFFFKQIGFEGGGAWFAQFCWVSGKRIDLGFGA
jgi:hypothetical protein